ncbi:hypothetical protein [Aneurinibacillus migulanus]|uniref:hypothetical protein n=1 Tax=Aneurinibacillus migulanus TaxID=47500 RepID=UPI001F2024EB|nr:hypothetical protein [Aneurinibacillus migulanus]
MINRQVFMVGGKKRRKGLSGRKKTRLPFFCWSAGHLRCHFSSNLLCDYHFRANSIAILISNSNTFLGNLHAEM